MGMKRLFCWVALVGFLLPFFCGCAAPETKFCIKCKTFVTPDHEHFIKKEEKTESPQTLLLPAEALVEDSLARMSG